MPVPKFDLVVTGDSLHKGCGGHGQFVPVMEGELMYMKVVCGGCGKRLKSSDIAFEIGGE